MNIQAPIILKIELPDLDSNQGFQLQRLTCYRYTIGHRYLSYKKILDWFNAAPLDGLHRLSQYLSKTDVV